ALNSPEKTLRILSDYFRESGRAEESVTAPFSLLFAFAYGVRGDIDQSLAWFSRTNRIHAGVGGFSEAASSGLRALLRVPTQNELMLIGERWASDSFVSLILGQELRRRNLEPAPYEEVDMEDATRYARFWQIGIHSQENRLEQSGAGKTVLGVILPLSGKQAALGEKVKNGIELAFLGQGAEQDFVIDVRDSRGEPLAAMSAYRSFVNADVPTVVLGPLLSEPSDAVAGIAERSELPVLVFSKKSTFETGENIFRLGPTLQSQIRALLEKVIPLRGIRRIAIAVPVGAVGDFYREVFLREVAKHDAQVVYQARYLPGNDTELVAMSAELELVEADALFFPGSLKEASRLVANFSQQTRDRFALLGLGTWDNPRELQKSRSVLNGAMFVSPFNARSARDVVQRFQEAYERKFGVAPDFLAAQGFDAATLAISAYRQAKEEQLSYSDGLRSIEQYNGLTGRISVENTGELQRDFEVLELRDGQLAALEIAESSLVVTPSYVLDELSSELPTDTLGEFR
ncbi:MAG: penicillin-binding protein activator, partial [Bdellovibrionota bacterium]